MDLRCKDMKTGKGGKTGVLDSWILDAGGDEESFIQGDKGGTSTRKSW
jgi:hypothetical protein